MLLSLIALLPFLGSLCAAFFPSHARNAAAWLHEVLVEPFADFVRRYRWQAVLILSLIAVYRISDVVMGGIVSSPV